MIKMNERYLLAFGLLVCWCRTEIAALEKNVTEQRCTVLSTLLSSITVLRDSIHMGSISPSRTIHLGPSWPTEVSSLMVEENRPNIHTESKQQLYFLFFFVPVPYHHLGNVINYLFNVVLKLTHVMELKSNYCMSKLSKGELIRKIKNSN